MDVDAILASLETGRAGALEQWLEENPERTGKFWRLIVQLSKRACVRRHDYVLNAIHEAAHVALQQHGVGDYHGPAFWQMYGRMVDAFDHHGHDDSKAYPVN